MQQLYSHITGSINAVRALVSAGQSHTSMLIKIIILILLLAVGKLLLNPAPVAGKTALASIDKEWWGGLSEEWKNILIINQNFQQQGIDIFKLQDEYINRLNHKDEAGYSEENRSLHELNDLKRFSLGYADLYARAIRNNHMIKGDSIDLAILPNLETLYLVNGPSDLSPLQSFRQLKVLIINSCGITGSNKPLNLQPVRFLKKLKVLHCSSIAIHSLPIDDLINLEELNCDNSSITTLDPLRKLVNLKRLSFGSRVKDASPVSKLENLEELYINGCKKVTDLSRLKKLRTLCISEGELSILNSSHRVTNIDFLAGLKELEYLDLGYTSYKGSLEVLCKLQRLKAVTLPAVGSFEMRRFRSLNPRCIITNAFLFE